MATLDNQLETALLSKNCKVDLFNHMEQLQLQSASLPKRPTTFPDPNLPSAVEATTFSKKMKEDGVEVSRDGQKHTYLKRKAFQTESLGSASMVASNSGTSYFKDCKAEYHDELKGTCPFRSNRNRSELTGVEKDFAFRYADKMMGTHIERPKEEDAATLSATEAYKKAFRSYMGRDPNEKELDEVVRLNFGFNERGEVGVIQTPHSCFPHNHITCCNRRPCKCPNQIYTRDVPHVRAARDRFPGPIPVWTSTKNLHALMGNEMYTPGHHSTRGVTLPPVGTMVTSKGLRHCRGDGVDAVGSPPASTGSAFRGRAAGNNRIVALGAQIEVEEWSITRVCVSTWLLSDRHEGKKGSALGITQTTAMMYPSSPLLFSRQLVVVVLLFLLFGRARLLL
eukprot:gene4342-3156_t